MSSTRGSVYQRGTTWTAHVKWREGGRDRQRKKGGYRTEKEAQIALTVLLGSLDVGRAVPVDRITVSQYLTGWLEHLETVAGRKPSTVHGYRGTIARYVTEPVGATRMQAVTTGHIDGIYRSMAAKGLAPATIRQTHAVLRKAFADAVRQGVVASNPVERATPPSGTAAKAPTFPTWTFDQLGEFLAHIQGRARAEAIEFAALTGARRGEVCALRWDDVDLAEGVATIRRSLAELDGELVEGGTKTHRVRTVSLDDSLVAMLRAHRKTQNEWRLMVGEYWQDMGLVFPSPDGGYTRPSTLGQQFDRLVQTSGVRRIRFHDLRHTHATLLIASGWDAKLVSERLGHSTVAFTLDRYTHPSREQQASAANDFAARIGRR